MNRKLTLAAMILAAITASTVYAQTGSAEPSEHTTVIQLQKSEIAPEDQPTDKQLDKLFTAMRLRSQFDTMVKSMSALMQQQVAQQIKEMDAGASGSNVSAEKQKAIEAFTKKYMDRAMALYPVTEMIQDMGNLYKRHINREDVDAITAFYQSPAAQHLLDVQPEIMQEYMPIVQTRVQERTKILMDEMKRDAEKMKQSSQSHTNKQS